MSRSSVSRRPLLLRFVAFLSSKYSVVYLFVLPAVIIRMIFTLAPLIQTLAMSFTNKSMMNQERFIGLKNYLDLIQDKTLIAAFFFTLVYTGASMLVETALGLGIAVLLTQKLLGRWLSNFIMLLPWVMAPLLAAIVWKIMYYEDGGILNDLFRRGGLISEPVRWLSDANTARLSVILTTVWKNVSWVALILMAGMGSVSPEIYEAATVDGANSFQRFRYITLPLLRSSLLLVLMFRGMGEIQTFEQITGLTRGGPGTATQTLAVYAYRRFFQELRYGYGSAINVLLLVLTIAIGGFFAWRLYSASR
jgi:ABC-type sugar transport system permease subunit